MTYSVEITETAERAIAEQARFIAVERQAPRSAGQWLERIWNALDTLEHFPRRGPIAPESEHVNYEVRMLIVGKHLILFTIDEDQHKVFVIGFRRSKRQPRPKDLPEQAEGE